MPFPRVITTASEDETFAVGEALGRVVRGGDVIALLGDLGAGKTLFVRGLARGLGVPPTTPITSPTFTLVSEYRTGRLPLFHVDLYRIDREEELEDLGLDDLYRQGGVVAVEWFDRFPDAAPRDVLEVRLTIASETARRLEIQPRGPAAAALADAWSLA